MNLWEFLKYNLKTKRRFAGVAKPSLKLSIISQHIHINILYKKTVLNQNLCLVVYVVLLDSGEGLKFSLEYCGLKNDVR